jgi:putative phosphoesterase
MMRTIGVISDTHGLLRPQALAALAGCDPIIHAGDIGSPAVLARLGALAPVHAVRGNVDHGAWSATLPVTQRIEIDGFRIYVLHILAELNPQAADNVDAVIYGHSHQPKIETTNGTLFFNPGSAGPRRFRLPLTVGRLDATGAVATSGTSGRTVATAAAPANRNPRADANGTVRLAVG